MALTKVLCSSAGAALAAGATGNRRAPPGGILICGLTGYSPFRGPRRLCKLIFPCDSRGTGSATSGQSRLTRHRRPNDNTSNRSSSTSEGSVAIQCKTNSTGSGNIGARLVARQGKTNSTGSGSARMIAAEIQQQHRHEGRESTLVAVVAAAVAAMPPGATNGLQRRRQDTTMFERCLTAKTSARICCASASVVAMVACVGVATGTCLPKARLVISECAMQSGELIGLRLRAGVWPRCLIHELAAAIVGPSQ